jgi:hypothetical protein
VDNLLCRRQSCSSRRWWRARAGRAGHGRRWQLGQARERRESEEWVSVGPAGHGNRKFFLFSVPQKLSVAQSDTTTETNGNFRWPIQVRQPNLNETTENSLIFDDPSIFSSLCHNFRRPRINRRKLFWPPKNTLFPIVIYYMGTYNWSQIICLWPAVIFLANSLLFLIILAQWSWNCYEIILVLCLVELYKFYQPGNIRW